MEARRPIPKPHGAQTGRGRHCPPTTPLPVFSRPDSDDSGFSTQREAANGGLARGREGRLLQPLPDLKGGPAPPAPGPAAHCSRASACLGEPGPQGAHPGAPSTLGWLGKPTAGASALVETPQTTDGLPGIPRRAGRTLLRPHPVAKAPVRGQAPLPAPAAKPTPLGDPHHHHCIGPTEPPSPRGAPSVGQAHRSKPCNTRDTSKEERPIWDDHTESRGP